MANFFSSDYWRAFYFKAMGGQETATDPNAMRGTFAGSATWTGTLDLPAGSISGLFAGTSAFVGTLTPIASATETPRRGGKDDGPRFFRRRRRAYVEFTEKRLEEVRRRERELDDALLEAEPIEPEAIELVPPPLPIVAAKKLDPATEYERVMALMDASLKALSENATRLANEQLRKKAKAAKVEVPSKDADKREQELRAMVVWLDARAGWLEQQRLEAERIEAERIALEQDEEDVIILLLAA